MGIADKHLLDAGIKSEMDIFAKKLRAMSADDPNFSKRETKLAAARLEMKYCRSLIDGFPIGEINREFLELIDRFDKRLETLPDSKIFPCTERVIQELCKHPGLQVYERTRGKSLILPTIVSQITTLTTGKQLTPDDAPIPGWENKVWRIFPVSFE